MKSEGENLDDFRQELVNEYGEQIKQIGSHNAAIGGFVGQAVNISNEHGMTIEQAFEQILDARQKLQEMVNNLKKGGK